MTLSSLDLCLLPAAPSRVAKPHVSLDVKTVRSSRAMSGVPLAALVSPARDGDTVAMRQLLTGLAPLVVGTVRRIIFNTADAEEVSQDSMLAITRDLHLLRDPRAIRGFASTLSTRIALRARKRMRNRSESQQALANAPMPPSAALDEVFARNQRAERVVAVLDELPSEQAEALLMRFVLGYKPSEIAAATDTPVNTVRSRIRLARTQLAKTLSPDPQPEGHDDG